MNLDLSRALGEIADSASAHADLGPADRIVGRRRRRRVVRRTVAGASTLAVLGGLLLAGTAIADWRTADPQPAVTGPAPTPASTPAATPASPPVTAPPVDPPVASEPDEPARPLADPYVSRWDGTSSITSDAPVSGDVLEDGSFFGYVLATDPAAGTVTVDVALFYGGQAATDWALVNEPEQMAQVPGWPLNSYVVVNDVERARSLTLGAGVVVTGFCVDAGTVRQDLRSVTGLTEADPACPGESSAAGTGRSGFWVDVRDGAVVQLVGQYLP